MHKIGNKYQAKTFSYFDNAPILELIKLDHNSGVLKYVGNRYTFMVTLDMLNQYFNLVDSHLVFNSPCSHEWKMYNGFNESYYFCLKCDEKRRD